MSCTRLRWRRANHKLGAYAQRAIAAAVAVGKAHARDSRSRLQQPCRPSTRQLARVAGPDRVQRVVRLPTAAVEEAVGSAIG